MCSVFLEDVLYHFCKHNMSSLQSSHQKGLRTSCANSLLNTSMKEQKEGAASEAASSESWSFYCASLLPFISASQQTMKRVGQIPPLQLSVVIVKLSILILPKRWIFGTKEPSKNWEDWNQCCVIRRVKTTDWTGEWKDNHMSLWLNSSLLLS